MRLKWSTRALDQYAEQITYLALRNPDAAETIEKRLEDALDNLSVFPKMGKAGRVEGTFERIVKNTPLVVVYIIDIDAIVILNILHTSQDYP